MKKLIVAVAFFACTSALAQNTAIKLNLLSPVLRTINVSFEQGVSEKSSAQLGFFYTGVSIGDLLYRGIGITPEFRFHVTGDNAIDGFYVAPFLRYQSLKLSYEDDTNDDSATLSTFGGGLLIGNQWVMGERITLDIFIGPSYNTGKVKAEADSSSETFDVSGSFNGFGVRTGITLGIAF